MTRGPPARSANLSNDYFTQRQDRCVVIEDRQVADLCADVIAATSATSLRLQGDGALAPEGIDPRHGGNGTACTAAERGQGRCCRPTPA